METLQELLIEELKDTYSAEKQIIKALPKLIKGAESDSLKQALKEHLEVTKNQVTRLDEVFRLVGKKASAKQCKGMEGLLTEGNEQLEAEEAGTLRDLALIAACQKVEHYEVAAYGTARALAEQCGLDEAVELLSQTLEEEVSADETLTTIAEELYAEMGGEGEEDEDEEDEPEDEEMEEEAPPGMGGRKTTMAGSKGQAQKR